MNRNSLVHKNGVVYTPKELSDYLATKICKYVFEDVNLSTNNELSVLDPANGDGMLLEAILKKIHSLNYKKVTLCGIDIDNFTNESSRDRIESLEPQDNLILINTNSLTPYYETSLALGWNRLFNQMEFNGFDIMIANPPWGADISEYKEYLDESYFTLLNGQVDSYELFIELALKVVNKGGYFGFLIPDSILNHGKIELRKRILSNTQIKFIARLGEKLFPGINRACAILICKNSPPINNNLVDCFRLNKTDREKITSKIMTFEESELIHSHKIPQKRFQNNENVVFNIDLRENEVEVLNKMVEKTQKIKDVLSITRGVELGSSGYVYKCPNCDTWSPLSNKNIVRCNNCKNENKNNDIKKEVIITDKKLSNSIQLITGRNIKRYKIKPNLWIKKDYDGINYKSKLIYEPPKILIRKTGVGITASLDYSDSYTTQVVYILKSKKNTQTDLEYAIALINSRAYFFYLMKTFGELEWRSHPYLTQSQIQSFPFPIIKSKKDEAIANRIKMIIRQALKKGRLSKSEDLEIELLVGKIFNFNKNDYNIIFNTINDLDELIPIKELKNIKLEEIIQKIGE